MNTRTCGHEEEAILATRQGRLTKELDSHIEDCRSCSSAVATAGWLHRESRALRVGEPGMDASAILWRARLRRSYEERLSKVRDVRRALDISMRIVGVLIAVALISSVYLFASAGHAAIAKGTFSVLEYYMIALGSTIGTLAIGGWAGILRLKRLH